MQACIVHLIRNSLNFVSWKDRKNVVAALRPIYTAPTESAALEALAAFEAGDWGRASPHRRRLALQLGAGHSLLRLPAGHPPGDLHCQRHRKSAHADPDGDQESRPLPERRGGQQIPMGGAEKHHRRLEPGYAGMEVRDELFCLPLHEPFCGRPRIK